MLVIDQTLTCDLCGAQMRTLRQTMNAGAAMQHIERGPVGVTQWHDVCESCAGPLREALAGMNAPARSDSSKLALLGMRVRAHLNANILAERIDVDGAEVYTIRNFLTPLECEMVINRIDALAEPSKLYETNGDDDHRTSYSSNFLTDDVFIDMLQRRMDACLGMYPEYGERLQGQRYEVGQQFKAHQDWFWPDTSYYQMEMERGGQRSWTAMTYLNEVEEGGETVFHTLGLTFKPEPGMLLIWNNATPYGDPNKAVMHSGEPVIKGVKYITTKWYRERKWN